MNRETRSNPLERSADDPASVHAAYDRAEAMVDRYGLAYVCRHPEILFGRLPRNEFLGRGYQHPAYGALAEYVRGNHSTPLPGDRDLIGRVTAAYRVQRDVYAPDSERANGTAAELCNGTTEERQYPPPYAVAHSGGYTS